MVAAAPEVAEMFLVSTAAMLMERNSELESDREFMHKVELRQAALTDRDDAGSGAAGGIALDDRARRGRDAGPDIGWLEHLDPAPCTEHPGRRLVGPVQPQAKS